MEKLPSLALEGSIGIGDAAADIYREEFEVDAGERLAIDRIDRNAAEGLGGEGGRKQE